MFDWRNGLKIRDLHVSQALNFHGPDWYGREKRLEPSGELAR